MHIAPQKIPRNALCPCGNQKKFKECHGIEDDYWPSLKICQAVSRIEATEEKRMQLEGLGRPIISTSLEGARLVAVGREIIPFKGKTFHDFLLVYIVHALGSDFMKEELKKLYAERHPILQWHQHVYEYQEQTTQAAVNGEIVTAPMIGSVDAYIKLSYNLYLISHNEELHGSLVKRLKNINQFPGAYYETHVFAWLIKAGFTIDFEDERDRSSSHVECVVTNPKTKEKFCVEAKSINRLGALGAVNSATNKPIEQTEKNAMDQLRSALKKEAQHPRIVFINLNAPDGKLEASNLADRMNVMLKNDERRQKEAPKAYIIFTNHPSYYHVQKVGYNNFHFGMGFKIPDFGHGKTLSLRERIKSEIIHKNIYTLMRSILAFHNIPSEFPLNAIDSNVVD